MELNYILLWTVGFSSLGSLLQVLRVRSPNSRGWILVLLFILGVEAVGLFVRPHIAGYVAGATWFALQLLPVLGTRYLSQLGIRQEYRRAAFVARVVSWLHPFDGWTELPRIWRALDLAERGKIEPASEILENVSRSRSPLAASAMGYFYRIRAQWEEALAWARSHIAHTHAQRDPHMMALMLRALGETGDLRVMIGFFVDCEPFLQAAQASLFHSQLRMMLFAFCGKGHLVREILSGSLRSFPEKAKTFWLATAEMAAGEIEAAREQFRTMLGEPSLRVPAERRLTHPLANPREILTAPDEELLARIEHEFQHEQRYGASFAPARRPYATWILVALNAAAFVVEILAGGSMNGEALFRLGAVMPIVVRHGGWWRLVTGLYLHFGPVHLAMNMIGLLAIGLFVERALGRWRYAVCYLCAGILSNALVVALGLRSEALRYELLVGASGSVMGLVGATAAICWQDWRKLKTQTAQRRLRWAALVVVLQTIFDLATPQVSFTAHLSGAVAGFLLAALLHRQNT